MTVASPDDFRYDAARAAWEFYNNNRAMFENAANFARTMKPWLDQMAPVHRTMQQMLRDVNVQGIIERQRAAMDMIAASFALRTPTAAEMTAAAARLEELDVDEQVEVAEAVEEISGDPDQLSLAQQLTQMFSQMKEAASNPVFVLVFVFCVAMQLTAAAVNALALAVLVLTLLKIWK